MPSTPKIRSIRCKPEPLTRCSSNKKAKNDKRSPGHASYDFLKQSIPSISHFEGFRRSRSKSVEQAFFLSLKNLFGYYNSDLPKTSTEPFPFNILSAFRQAGKMLENKAKSVELIITELDNTFTLATIEELGISYTIYYVPINALDWLHQQKNQKSFALLLSVFAYLNQSAGLPLLGHNDFMLNCYDATSDWVTNGEEEYEQDDWRIKMASLTEIRRKLPLLEKAVSDPAQFSALNERVSNYIPDSDEEKSLHTIAQKILALHKEFPSKNFFHNIYTGHLEPDTDERGYPDQYFSFFWDDNDWLYQSLMEYVNSDLQERSCFEQPVSIQYFNTLASQPQNTIDFEKRLLDLISELSSITYLFAK